MKIKKPITKEINGDEVSFYPLPIGILLKCRVLGDSVSTLLSTFFADTSHDTDVTETTFPVQLGDEKEVYVNKEVDRKALQPSMASLRINQKKEGIKAIIDALTMQGTQEILAEMVCRSAKDEKLTEDFVLQELDTEALIECLKGVLEANKGVFGSLGKLSPLLNLEGAGEALAAKVEGAVKDAMTKE